MRKFSLMLFLFLGLACNKDDDPDKNTSINGYWVVRTPDSATDVTFRIGQDADEQYIIETASVRHNGSDYNSKPIDAEITVLSPQEIETITILNNSPAIPFFVVRFLDISVNGEFTEMEITNSTFNIDGVFREFSMIKATRD